MRVLRMVNTAAAGLPRRVSSIGGAVVLTGTDELRRWVLLMLVADLTDDNQAHLYDALTHARLCATIRRAVADADATVASSGGRTAGRDQPPPAVPPAVRRLLGLRRSRQ